MKNVLIFTRMLLCLLEIGLCMDLSLKGIVAIIIFADYPNRSEALVLAMA